MRQAAVDAIKDFIGTQCEIGPYCEKVSTLWAEYELRSGTRNPYGYGRKTFSVAMAAQGHPSVKAGGSYYYFGLRLRRT